MLKVFLLILSLGLWATVNGYAKKHTAPDGIRWRFQDAQHYLVIADWHSDPDAVLSILSYLGIIDGGGNPTERARGLYICQLGDWFGKGKNSRFLFEFEHFFRPKMEAIGGRFDSIYGNHEIEDLLNPWERIDLDDALRYLDFAPPGMSEEIEAAVDRARSASERMGRNFRSIHAHSIRNAESDNFSWTAFLRAMSLGPRFRHSLTTRNIIMQYGRTVLVHGSLTDAMSELHAEEIGDLNANGRSTYGEILAQIAQRAHEMPVLPWFFSGTPDSPLTSRGMALGTFAEKKIRKILKHLDADRVIIGHSRTEDGRIGFPYGIPRTHGEAMLNEALVLNAETGIANRKKGHLSAIEFDRSRGGILLHEEIPRSNSTHPVRAHLEPIFASQTAEWLPPAAEEIVAAVEEVPEEETEDPAVLSFEKRKSRIHRTLAPLQDFCAGMSKRRRR